MQVKEKKQFIIRFLVANLSILLPVLVAVIWITNSYIVKTEKEERKQIQLQLEDIVQSISNDFYEYVNKSVVLFSGHGFASKNPFLEAESALRALELLQTISAFNKDESLCLYYGDDKIYYSAGMEHSDVYFGMTLNCTDDSIQKAIQLLESGKKEIAILNTKQGVGYLMYHIPIDKSMQGYSRSMQVYISFSSFANTMKSIFPEGEKLLILSVGEESSYFYDNGKVITQIASDEADQLQENCKWYQAETYGSNPDFTIKALCNIDKRLSGFYELRNISILILTIGILVSSVVALFLSSVRISNVETLVKGIANHKTIIDGDRSKKRKYRNEFEYLGEILNDLRIQREKIHDRNCILKQNMLQQVSIMMFLGTIREREEIQNALKLCNVELFEDFYYICGIKMDSQEQLERLDKLLSTDIRYIYKDKYMFILGEISCLDYDLSKRKKVVENLNIFLKNNDLLPNQIVVSRVLNKAWPIDFSYLEIINILENSNKKQKQVVFWEDWVQRIGKAVDNLEGRELGAFHEAILSKSYKQAEAILKTITEYDSVQAKNEDKIYERFLIVQMLIIDLRIYDKREWKQWLADEIAYIDLLDEAGFERKIIKILRQYHDEDQKEVLFDKILQLIEENCFKYDISLEMLAEQTGVSKSWVSKMLKNRLGINYTEYVTRIRMNKAKELLETTDMNIGEVFAAVGYVDNVTAGRNFKKYFKMTPSEYCQKVKSKKIIEDSDIPENL